MNNTYEELEFLKYKANSGSDCDLKRISDVISGKYNKNDLIARFILNEYQEFNLARRRIHFLESEQVISYSGK